MALDTQTVFNGPGDPITVIVAKNPITQVQAPAVTMVDQDGAAVALATQATLEALRALVAGVLVTADKNGAAFSSATPMTADQSATPAGRSVEVLCSAGGSIVFNMAGGGQHTIVIADSPFTQTFPYSVTGVAALGTTATATYANLY